MRIPADAVIVRDKLTRYLLVPKRKNDKAGFLARAGFTQANPDDLEAALRQLVAASEAVPDREDEYGRFYRVSGDLRGPDGILSIVTIWIRQHVDGVYRFITLKPDR
jgi:hypothetical protein